MIKTYLSLALMIGLLAAQSSSSDLHKDALVVDMHTDVLLRHMRGRSMETFSRSGHVDLTRLQQGGVDVQFFALWPNPHRAAEQGMYSQAVLLLDTLDAIAARNTDRMAIARTPAEIESITARGKLAACIGLEGGTALEGELTHLDYFYRRGVRYMGLTWNDSPPWASSAKDEQSGNAPIGLNAFGRKVVQRMNTLGMMVDLAHAGPKTFEDVMAVTNKPVIVSHSGLYGLCPHYRNLTDHQLQVLAGNGGAVFINFYPGYLVAGFDSVYQAARKRATFIEDSLKSAGIDSAFDRSAYIHTKIDPLYPGVATVVDHIEYVINRVGDDHVGIGSDYDGISLTPAGLHDVSKLPALTKEMRRRGFPDATIKKVLGGNFMRIFRAVTQ